MKKSIIITSIIVLILIAVGVYALLGNKNSGATTTGNSIETKTIVLQASRFQYEPGTITVNKGDRVKIIVNDTDTKHGIAIPDFGVSGTGSVEFTADKAGTFEFHCPTMCGPGHREMAGTLIVV